MKKLTIILIAFLPLIGFGQTPIFDFDARTGLKNDFITNEILTDYLGGLFIDNQLYGQAIIANDVGYIGNDSIYDLGTSNWTIETAITVRGLSTGGIAGQFNTIIGWDLSLTNLNEITLYDRNNAQNLINPRLFYSIDSTYHLKFTHGADDTVKVYVNGELYSSNYFAGTDLNSDTPLTIATRRFNSPRMDSTDIYLLRIFNDRLPVSYAIESSENFFNGYQTTINTPTDYDPYRVTPYDMVYYFHGNGGTYTQDPPATWLDSLLNRNYVVAQTSGTNHWGNDLGQSIYSDNLYNYVLNNFNIITTPQLLSISMGTLASFNQLRGNNPMKAKSNVLISSVINLDSCYYANNQLFAGGIKTAYNFTTDGQYNDSTAGYNPIDDIVIGADTIYSKTILPVYWMTGELDTIAPVSEVRLIHNSLKNQNSTLSVVNGAYHGSTQVSTPTEINKALEWMELYRGESPVNPITLGNIVRSYGRNISSGGMIIKF